MDNHPRESQKDLSRDLACVAGTDVQNFTRNVISDPLHSRINLNIYPAVSTDFESQIPQFNGAPASFEPDSYFLEVLRRCDRCSSSLSGLTLEGNHNMRVAAGHITHPVIFLTMRERV